MTNLKIAYGSGAPQSVALLSGFPCALLDFSNSLSGVGASPGQFEKVTVSWTADFGGSPPVVKNFVVEFNATPHGTLIDEAIIFMVGQAKTDVFATARHNTDDQPKFALLPGSVSVT